MDTVFVILIVLGLVSGALVLMQSGRNETPHQPIDRETQAQAALRRRRIQSEFQARLVKQAIRREGVQLRREIKRRIEELDRTPRP